ncbi:hypothetical protein [Erwinia tasmaniensis]|uniref:hypothetical protein n=1 Tax=Erwinia tasmaniensis TaxID=338565 RepID=UPI003A4D562E
MLSELTPSAAAPDVPDGGLHLTGEVSGKMLTHWQDKDLYQPAGARFVTVASWHIPVHDRHP